MAWKTVEKNNSIGQISERFPDGLDSDYVDPVLGRSLVEHLKSYWLTSKIYGYAPGYEGNKVRELLEPEKFSEKDWYAIAKVCGFSRSWAVGKLEEYEEGAA